ncbi:MAG: glycoside hydrolase family 47 protein, partial [Gluconacetobacter diazotrophicus]|nr:glycoside hydrolase family 47 protein [Gluconacetobacter diazotrophicus]
GLLAGYLAVRDERLLNKARELADRVMPAFERSPTGIPYATINLATGRTGRTQIALAEAGSNLLEFGTLSRLTGDARYRDAAKRSLAAIFARRSALDLLGTTIDCETGAWVDPVDVSIDQPTDSFYEYLWGGYAMFGDADCLRWFRTLNAALDRHVVRRVGGMVWYGQVDFRTGAPAGSKQTELASFWGELAAAAGEQALGEEYYRSWTTVLDRYPVLPEEIDFTTLQVTSPKNRFRPEYVNASFDLYWQTGETVYAETAWRYFAAMREHARVANGYTILEDVTVRPMIQGDLFPAYGFAENFKYLYLIYARTPRFDTGNYWLSTEGKVLRGLRK